MRNRNIAEYQKPCCIAMLEDYWKTQFSEKKVLSEALSTRRRLYANNSKRKLFYAFRPSVHMKMMKTLTVNA